MIHCVEVLAIYEELGTAPSGAVVGQRDVDFQLAQDRVALVGGAVAPQSNEIMRRFPEDGDSRYGTGWRCRQWISVKNDAETVGSTIWARLMTRNMKNGTIVTVFPLDETIQTPTVGPISYRRRLPAGIDDIG